MPQPASLSIGKYPRFSLNHVSLRKAWQRRLTGNVRLTYGGRYSIYHSLVALGLRPEDEVLIPSYHCPAMLMPIQACGCKIAFYAVDDALKVGAEHLINRISERTRLVVLVHYFGIYQAETARLARELSARNVYLLEDCAHVIPFTGHKGGTLGDLAIFSPWKYLPILDGGILGCNNGHLNPAPSLRNPPLSLALKNLKNAIERGGHSTARGILSHFFWVADKLFNRTRSALLPAAGGDASLTGVAFSREYAAYSATVFSRWRIHVADFQRIYDIRSSISRRLFADVYERGGFMPPPFLCKDPGNCVFGFPVMVRDRAAAVAFLRSRSISHFTFGDARALPFRPAADSPEAKYCTALLFVPVLQDFADREIEYLAACVKELLAQGL